MGATHCRPNHGEIAASAFAEFLSHGGQYPVDARLDGIVVEPGRPKRGFVATVRATIAGSTVVVHGPARASPEEAVTAALAFAWRGVDPDAPPRPSGGALIKGPTSPGAALRPKHRYVCFAINLSFANLLQANAGLYGPFA